MEKVEENNKLLKGDMDMTLVKWTDSQYYEAEILSPSK